MITEQHVLLLGAYAPLTKDGNILVDGVLASSYAGVDHDLSHLTMIPMQWYPEIIEQIFLDEIGFPVILSMARELAILMLPCGLFF